MIELVALGGPPLQPAPTLLVGIEERRAGGKPLSAAAGRLHARIALEAGNGGVVHAPFRTGKLRVAVGREPQRQAAEAGVAGVTLHQFPHGRQHRLLHARIKRIVIRRQAAARTVRAAPGGAVRPDPLQPLSLRSAAAAERLQGRQRRGELQRRNQLQVFAVHQPQQHLQHVLLLRILPAGKEHARIVARGWFEDRAGIDRATVGRHGEHQAVVARIAEIVDEPRAGLMERLPVLQRPPDPGVEGFLAGKILRQQRPVHVSRDQALRGGSLGHPAFRQSFPAAQHADLAVNRWRPLAAIGDQQQRRASPRPEDEPVPLPMRRGRGRGLVGDVDARVQSDRHQDTCGVGLDDAQPKGLRHIAGIVDLQQARPPHGTDVQRIGLPTDVGRDGTGLELRDVAQTVMDRFAHAVAQRAAQAAGEPGQGRQLDLFPPTGTGGIDLQQLRQFAGGLDRRLPARDHHELHAALGDRPRPVQRLAQGTLPAAALLGRDDDIVNALLFRQREFQRHALATADMHVLCAGPRRLSLAVHQLGLDLQRGVGGHGQEMRDDLETQRFAGSKDHRGARHAHQQRITRRGVRAGGSLGCPMTSCGTRWRYRPGESRSVIRAANCRLP